MTRASKRGHRLVGHTADVIIEAWGPTRTACLEEALVAFIESFAEPVDPQPRPVATLSVTVDGVDGLLEEVLFRMDTDGMLPALVTCADPGDGPFVCRLEMCPLQDFSITGAVPKAVSLSGLVFERRGGGWWCRVLVDV